MTFSRKIILIAAVALAISLGTACSFFDATPEVNHKTAKPTATGEATNSALPPENGAANNAVATQPRPSKQTLQEDQRWCQAWTLDNLKPHVYAKFVKLDPERMGDLNRTVWRSRMPSSSLPTYLYEYGPRKPINSQLCWMYWSELLSKANADQRNQQYEAECHRKLLQHADSRWDKLASAAVREKDTTAYEIPNQYIRVLRWLDIPGQELLEMDEPPHELLRRMYDKKYAYNSNIPTGTHSEAEWWGILNATLMGRGYGIDECKFYYPQLYYGYWVPFAVPSDEWPDQLSEEEVTEIERLREGPLYLPRP